MDLRQEKDILSNGWESNSTQFNYNYEDLCDTIDTWYGWYPGQPEGVINTTFQGNGRAHFSFGNCYGTGVVNVFLNEKIISEASPLQRNNVTFDYLIGDRLTIVEKGGTIWKLYSLNLCHN